MPVGDALEKTSGRGFFAISGIMLLSGVDSKTGAFLNISGPMAFAFMAALLTWSFAMLNLLSAAVNLLLWLPGLCLRNKRYDGCVTLIVS